MYGVRHFHIPFEDIFKLVEVVKILRQEHVLKTPRLAASVDRREQCTIIKLCWLRQNTDRNKTNEGGNRKDMEIVRFYLYTSDISYMLMEYATVPPYQMVNAAYCSQVNQRGRRYRNVDKIHRQTGPCSLHRECIYNVTLMQLCTLLWFLYIYIIILYIEIL